jgi:hypothetical protein
VPTLADKVAGLVSALHRSSSLDCTAAPETGADLNSETGQ